MHVAESQPQLEAQRGRYEDHAWLWIKLEMCLQYLPLRSESSGGLTRCSLDRWCCKISTRTSASPLAFLRGTTHTRTITSGNVKTVSSKCQEHLPDISTFCLETLAPFVFSACLPRMPGSAV